MGEKTAGKIELDLAKTLAAEVAGLPFTHRGSVRALSGTAAF